MNDQAASSGSSKSLKHNTTTTSTGTITITDTDTATANSKEDYYFKNNDLNLNRVKVNQNDFDDDDDAEAEEEEDVDEIVAKYKNSTNKSAIFTCANRPSVLSNTCVDSLCTTTTATATTTSLSSTASSGTLFYNGGNNTRFVATNKRYETFRQNKQTCEQNTKSSDEIYEINDTTTTTTVTASKVVTSSSTTSNSTSTTNSTSNSPVSSRRSSYDADEGYCDNKAKNNNDSGSEHVVLKMYGDDDVLANKYKINDYKSIVSDEFDSLNPKHKFLQYIESTQKLSQQQSKNYNHYFSTQAQATAAPPPSTINYIDDDCDDLKDDCTLCCNSNSSSMGTSVNSDSHTTATVVASNIKYIPMQTFSKTITTTKATYDDHKPKIESDSLLLNELTYHLNKKFTPEQKTKAAATTTTTGSGGINMQFNNYDVDKSLSFGLKVNTSTANVITSSSGHSVNSQKVRLNNDINIDSHGSSLTNSSKQDDSSDNSEEMESKNDLKMTIDDITGEMIAKTRSDYKYQIQQPSHTSQFKNAYHDLYSHASQSAKLSFTNQTPSVSSSSSASTYVNKNSYSGLANNNLLNQRYPDYNTFDSLKPKAATATSNISTPPFANTSAAAAPSTTLGGGSLLNKKRRKKQDEATLTSNPVYSKHHDDDLDVVLKYINAAPATVATASNAAASNKNKTNQKALQHQTQKAEKPQTATKSNKKQKSVEKQDKPVVQPQPEEKPLDVTTTVKPESEDEATVQQEPKQPTPPLTPSGHLNLDILRDIDDENDAFDEEKQISNDFVTVKARKTRKLDKVKPQPQPQVQQQVQQEKINVKQKPVNVKPQQQAAAVPLKASNVNKNMTKDQAVKQQPVHKQQSFEKPKQTQEPSIQSKQQQDEQIIPVEQPQSRAQQQRQTDKPVGFADNLDKFPPLNKDTVHVTNEPTKLPANPVQVVKEEFNNKKVQENTQATATTVSPTSDAKKSIKSLKSKLQTTSSVIFLDELERQPVPTTTTATKKPSGDKKQMNKKLNSGNSLGIKFGCFNTSSEDESEPETNESNSTTRTSTPFNGHETDKTSSKQQEKTCEADQQVISNASETQQPVLCAMPTHSYYVNASTAHTYPFYNAPIQFFYTVPTYTSTADDHHHVNTQYTPLVALATPQTPTSQTTTTTSIIQPIASTIQPHYAYYSTPPQQQQSNGSKQLIDNHIKQQKLQQQQNEMIYVNTTNKKPNTSSNSNKTNNNTSPTIIADALQIAYSADKGHFNLDEAVHHFSNEWNRIKKQLVNGTNERVKWYYEYSCG